MKKTPALFLLGIVLMTSTAHAAVLAEKGTWQRKFQRGILNAAFSPVEISYALAEEKKKSEAFLSWFVGLGRGITLAGCRALSGVYDVLTFPLPAPAGYGPTLQPEFALEHLD